MTADVLSAFPDGTWCVDFEFHAPDGERPDPICMVARELRTKRTIRLWREKMASLSAPPFPIGPGALFVAYYASAEIGCFLSLGWPLPARILDLCVEFKNRTSGIEVPCGRGLVGALVYHGIDSMDAAEKESMRSLAIRGGPFTDDERMALLGYCESDVMALEKLLPAMLPRIDLRRALLRGRYMAAVGRMEFNGVPIDAPTLTRLRENWPALQEKLIERVDADYGCYERKSFKRDRFAAWVARNGIPWPLLDSGQLALDDDTFRELAKSYPAVAPLRELRHTLSELRLEKLAVGRDGRNRCLLSAFGSKTGRNQPSNSRFIFGPSVWLRSLIKPEPGRAIAYLDYEQQEFGIAAALSGDPAMSAAYASGDPYLTFAKQAGAVPETATDKTHPTERALFKQCILATQYLMGEQTLAARIGKPEVVARDLLRRHRETYPAFWRWSQGVVDHAMLFGWLRTVFGWYVHCGREPNSRSFANFPMQGNGAEILRLACSTATEAGIAICAPVHDALLIEAPADEIDEVAEETQRHMEAASRIVLSGFELRAKIEQVVRYPERYVDEKRGRRMWETVMKLLEDVE
jgi:hypothetical protein